MGIKWGQKFWGDAKWSYAPTIQGTINKPVCDVFRRAYIKRRSNTTGLYEAAWYEISDYVKKWGTIENSVDDTNLNVFKHSGISLTCRNDEGKFNPESNVNSFWYGYMTRFRTLLKIEAGYLDDDDVELPTTTTQGIFILTNDIPISGIKNEAILNFKSLVSIFDEVVVTEVASLGATQTASGLITRIRDHSDGVGNVVFRQFISSASWVIQATTNNYNCATTTSLDGLTCWELMEKLAETEGFILLVNRTGGLEFRDRNERTSTSQFTFYGQGFKEQNVISLDEYLEPINKFYNYFRLKFLEADTSTSYVISGTITTVNPSGTSWKYGSRTYEFENLFISDTTTAQSICTARRTQFDEIKEEIEIIAKFCPQLEISDKVTLNYRNYDLANTILWDLFNWDEENWNDESGEIFDWRNIDFKILAKNTNLDNFTTNLTLRRITP